MFSEVFVCQRGGGGLNLGGGLARLLGLHPKGGGLGRPPSELEKREVRILLGCFLVADKFLNTPSELL